MINKIISDELTDKHAKIHALNELGKEHYPEFSEIKYNFKHGVSWSETVLINAFHKACDSLNIDYSKQEEILNEMVEYLS